MCLNLRRWTHEMRIADVSVLRGERYVPGTEQEDVVGAKIRNIYRRGKFILLELDNRGFLVCHNAMSGYWDLEEDPWTFDYVEGKRNPKASDVRVSIKLETNSMDSGRSRNLRFHDARLFGSLRFYPYTDLMSIRSLRDLGPEAISTECAFPGISLWNPLDFVVSVGGSDLPIKQIIMDQRNVVGIGNIYANEALWHARIDPGRIGRNIVHSSTVHRLYESVREILYRALRFKLQYDKYLKIYRKKSCPRCDQKIMFEKIKGRSTYWCPGCVE